MWSLGFILNPPQGLTIPILLGLGFLLGLLHGATPDEHTWPITFSYSVGSYSSRGGMRAGLVFSSGFTIQRSILTVLGFLGLAGFYTVYNLDGPIYILVGVVMFIAGWYLLRGTDIHLPFDHWMERLLGPIFTDHSHHRVVAERMALPEAGMKPIPLRMAIVHGFVAGWGLGGFATILVFMLAPQMPNVGWAALAGTAFGLGTMVMQMITGALFARLARLKRVSVDGMKRIGRSTAARTLYVGGLAFVAVGAVVAVAPWLNRYSVSTGSSIPNLDSLGYATALIVIVVGVIGGTSLYRAYREVTGPPPSNSSPEGPRRLPPG